MPIARQTALPADILNKEGCLHSTMKNGESDESEMKVKIEELETIAEGLYRINGELETRVIALERGLEGVLRRLEESGQAKDEAGWFGRPE